MLPSAPEVLYGASMARSLPASAATPNLSVLGGVAVDAVGNG